MRGYGGTIHYESGHKRKVSTQKSNKKAGATHQTIVSTLLSTATKTKDKNDVNSSQSNSKQVASISLNKNTSTTVSSLKNMEVDYNWNGEYYNHSKHAQSTAIITSNPTKIND